MLLNIYDIDNISSKSRSEMIKFVLVFIAVILMILGIYNYSNQSTEKNTPKPTISDKKKEVAKIEKVSIVTQAHKEKKSAVKNTRVTSQKVVSQKPIQGMEQEINKGLTLESIENANVSDEEKELLIADIVYHQTNIEDEAEVLTFEEGLELIANDVKNGIIK